MKTVTEQSTNTDDLPSFDGIPLPNVADGLLAFLPLTGWLIAYGLRELIKMQIDKAKAEYQAELERQRYELEERAKMIESLRQRDEMLTREILNLNEAMERSGPLMEPLNKGDR